MVDLGKLLKHKDDNGQREKVSSDQLEAQEEKGRFDFPHHNPDKFIKSRSLTTLIIMVIAVIIFIIIINKHPEILF